MFRREDTQLPNRKNIPGVCLPWETVLAFLDTLAPRQELSQQVV